MKKLAVIFATLSIFASPAVNAQGTVAQRSACEDDAKKWCPYAIPDPDEVQNCLEKVVSQITTDCQAQFGYAAKKKRSVSLNNHELIYIANWAI